ncbi:MAG: hypothetical protein UV60_C0046G0001 [Parcubacteria group bacterium GW2011_GWA2_43_11]|nr:MAG: hypothetical protein UV60_C0046G0001 [Parcubacteria group bacterium GW2011_GWA2_43_11]
MKHITKSQKIAFVALSILLVVCVGYVFLFRHIASLQYKLAEITTELSVIGMLEAHKLETEALLNKTKAGREEIASYFISEEDPTPFLELVETLGKDAGATLEVEAISVDTVNADGGVSVGDNMKVVLLVEGSWKSLYHLMSLLEHMPYIATISSATFTVNEEHVGTWKGQIELLCSAR